MNINTDEVKKWKSKKRSPKKAQSYSSRFVTMSRRKQTAVEDEDEKTKRFKSDPLTYGDNKVEVIQSLINDEELVALRWQADELFRKFHESDTEDLADNGCAFDVMEDSAAPHSPIKVDLKAYLEARFSDQLSGCSSQSRRTFQEMILGPLTSTAQRILKSSKVYIFNEHFVIKPSQSCGKCTDVAGLFCVICLKTVSFTFLFILFVLAQLRLIGILTKESRSLSQLKYLSISAFGYHWMILIRIVGDLRCALRQQLTPP